MDVLWESGDTLSVPFSKSLQYVEARGESHAAQSRVDPPKEHPTGWPDETDGEWEGKGREGAGNPHRSQPQVVQGGEP